MEQIERPFSLLDVIPGSVDRSRMGRFGKFSVFPSSQPEGLYSVTELYQMATEAARKEVRGL